MKISNKLSLTSLIGITVSLAGIVIEIIQKSIAEKEQQDYISSEVQKQLDERLGKNPEK